MNAQCEPDKPGPTCCAGEGPTFCATPTTCSWWPERDDSRCFTYPPAYLAGQRYRLCFALEAA